MNKIKKQLESCRDVNQWLVNNKAKRIEVGYGGTMSRVYQIKALPNKVVKIARNNKRLNNDLYANPAPNTDLGMIFLKYSNVGVSQDNFQFCFQSRCPRPWEACEKDDELIIKAWDKLNVKLKKQKIGSLSHGTKKHHDVGFNNCGLDARGNLVVFDW
jgi:hypothetical protein